VQGREGSKNETLWEKNYMSSKVVRSDGWGESVSAVCVGEILGTVYSTV